MEFNENEEFQSIGSGNNDSESEDINKVLHIK